MVYVYVPSTELANKYSIRVVATSGSEDVSFTRTQSNSHGGTLPRNYFAIVPFNIADEVLPEGALSGVFSISSNRKVRFAQGNLQYQATSGLWRFATNQWDYVGDNTTHGNVYENNVRCSNSSIGPDYSGWIDLFGWGANGEGTTLPYANDRNNSHYGVQSSGSLGDYDWGKVTISNGGNDGDPELWFTLNSNQWNHILTNRQVNGGTGNGHTYSRVTINGVRGLLLYPDDYYQQESYNGRTNLFEVPEDCVFLPYAGLRTPPTSSTGSQSFSGIGSKAYYWINQYQMNSYYFLSVTDSQNPNAGDNSLRFMGMSVRLVQSAQ